MTKKTRNILWWSLALAIGVGVAALPYSGYDWLYYFYPQLKDGNAVRILNPLWVYLPFLPLQLASWKVAHILFALANVGLIGLAIRLTGAKRYFVILSLQFVNIFWLGQLDILTAFGVGLGYWAVKEKKPHWLGLSFLFLLSKPHIGIFIALFYFLKSRDLRSLIVPAIGLGLSMIVFGVAWPIEWVETLIAEVSGDRFTGLPRNISLFPYGLALFALLAVPLSFDRQIIVVVAATMLSTPYAPIYSLIILFVLPIPWWLYLLGSVPYLVGQHAYWTATIVPLLSAAWAIGPQLKITTLKFYNQRQIMSPHSEDKV